jgi:hypothetical protein
MEKKRTNFADMVVDSSVNKKRSGTSYGHLMLPRGVNVYSAEPGSRNILLDFLPYEVTDPKHPDRNAETGKADVGTLWYRRPYYLHRNVGVDEESVICPKSIKKPCPICEHRALRQKAGADKKELKSMNSSLRNLYVVVPLNDKKLEPVPHIFDISDYLFQTLLDDEIKANPKHGKFPDPFDGLSLNIRFSATTIENSKPFAEASRIDFEPRDEQYTEKDLKGVPNLDEVLDIMSYETLYAKFFEMEGEEDGGSLKGDDEDKPKRSRKSLTSDEAPKRSRKAPEKEEEQEEPKSERHVPQRGSFTGDYNKPKKEDPEEAPRRSRREPEEDEAPRSSRRKIEEEDEAPRRSRREPEEDVPSRKAPKESKNRCPYGHEFGEDNNEFKDCAKCEVWDDCAEEKVRK